MVNIKIFADGASLKDIAEAPSVVRGFTTNPTLMRQAGVTDYKKFALDVLTIVKGLPVSFEVFADDFPAMIAQAREISSWGDNVYVKVPITNTEGKFTGPVISHLSGEGIKLNITAVMEVDQVERIVETLNPYVPAIVSVFAGRIADTGRDPIPIMLDALWLLEDHPLCEVLWASPRELFNVVRADEIGCHIITVSRDILRKLPLIGKDLGEYSLETVKMFHEDARRAAYTI